MSKVDEEGDIFDFVARCSENSVMTSVASPCSDMTDDILSGDTNIKTEMKDVIEPMDTDKANSAVSDILGDIDLEEPLCDFLGQIDHLEERCYEYIASVIGNTPILRTFVNLYRGNDSFLVVSKHTGESWIKGCVNKTSFSIEFPRPEAEDAPVSGDYTQLLDVFIAEVEYRIGTLSITRK